MLFSNVQEGIKATVCSGSVIPGACLLMRFWHPAVSDSELEGSWGKVGERCAHTGLPEMQFKGRKHPLQINGFGKEFSVSGKHSPEQEGSGKLLGGSGLKVENRMMCRSFQVEWRWKGGKPQEDYAMCLTPHC